MTVAARRLTNPLAPTRRSPRRRVVLLVVALCAVLTLSVPASLQGFGSLIAVSLVALDLWLAQATNWIAFRRTVALDERQVAARNYAYRTGFRLIGLSLIVMYIASPFTFTTYFSGIAGADHGIALRHVLALVELLVVMPTAVLAWREPDARVDDDDDGVLASTGRRSQLIAGSVAAIGLVGTVLLLGPSMLPVRTITVVDRHASIHVTGAQCATFAGSREVGAGVGGAVHLHATACWNGHEAWVIGDPALPSPADLVVFQGGLPDPYLTRCGIEAGTDDFASASRPVCSSQLRPDGSVRYTMSSVVAPSSLPLLRRTLELELIVGRDGEVLAFG